MSPGSLGSSCGDPVCEAESPGDPRPNPETLVLADVADRHASTWSAHLVRRGTYDLDEALKAAAAAADAGVPKAMGYDSAPEEAAASELALMVEASLSTIAALIAAAATGAMALGLDDVVGTVTPGKLADLVVVDADPVADIGILADPAAIHLVLQLGTPVGGRALDTAL